MVDFSCVGLVGPEGERFGCDCGGNVDVNVVSNLAQRDDVLLELSYGQFGADFASTLGWPLADVVD